MLSHARRYRSEIVNYADDLCVLGKAPAAEMLATVERLMAGLKLPVNERKTRCLRGTDEAFEFLGYRIGRIHRPTGEGFYIGTRPSKASVQSISRRNSEMTARRYGQQSSEVMVERLNRTMFGESVKGLSAATITRLKRGWEVEYAEWRERDWHGHKFVYLWADGIYVNVRSDQRRCLLVVVGCDVHGQKHFLAIEAGFRESAESWKAVLLSLRDRGVDAPKLAVGDGALGLWSALAEVYPQTRAQRCWVHKTVNVLDKLPKSLQGAAKSMLHEIWQADTRKSADKALDRFVATYEAKYPKAVDCLVRDREMLFAFYDFPAAHWQHLRTTNPIESSFATIRLRTVKTRNCVSAKSGLSLVHQLAMNAQKRWRRLRGFGQLADVVSDVRFIDGIDERKIGRKAD